MVNAVCNRQLEEYMNDLHYEYSEQLGGNLKYYPKFTCFNDISNGEFFFDVVDEPKVGEIGHCMKATGDHVDITTLCLKTSAGKWEKYFTHECFETTMPMRKQIVRMEDYCSNDIAKEKFDVYKYGDFEFILSEDKDIQNFFINGYYIYDLRHDDTDCYPVTIEPRGIIVNRYATIITNKPFKALHDLKGPDKHIEYDTKFETHIGRMTLEEYFYSYPPEGKK